VAEPAAAAAFFLLPVPLHTLFASFRQVFARFQVFDFFQSVCGW